MLVFVDFEHADSRGEPHAQQLLAARTTLTYRLEDLSGRHCHLVRYDRIDEELLDRIGAEAVFISGNSSAPEMYSPDDLAPIHRIVRDTDLPIFGFCGGFQLLAEALGATLVPLDPPAEGVEDPMMTEIGSGQPFEFGYHPIELSPGAASHPLLAGFDHPPVVRHAHALHVPDPPAGFSVLASTRSTPVQMAAHHTRKVCGTQFHPEYWTDEHPDGRMMITNFLAWSGLR
ncbi:MAG: gamma-glutamyl-gamma-aminobutyrate hydrolase family protein [Actinomycetota bacterium]